jgi:hypothetical protein
MALGLWTYEDIATLTVEEGAAIIGVLSKSDYSCNPDLDTNIQHYSRIGILDGNISCPEDWSEGGLTLAKASRV